MNQSNTPKKEYAKPLLVVERFDDGDIHTMGCSENQTYKLLVTSGETCNLTEFHSYSINSPWYQTIWESILNYGTFDTAIDCTSDGFSEFGEYKTTLYCYHNPTGTEISLNS